MKKYLSIIVAVACLLVGCNNFDSPFDSMPDETSAIYQGTVISLGDEWISLYVNDENSVHNKVHLYFQDAEIVDESGAEMTAEDFMIGMPVKYVAATDHVAFPEYGYTNVHCTKVILPERPEWESMNISASRGTVAANLGTVLILDVDKEEWGSSQIYLPVTTGISISDGTGNDIVDCDLWEGMTVDFSVKNGRKDMFDVPSVTGDIEIEVPLSEGESVSVSFEGEIISRRNEAFTTDIIYISVSDGDIDEDFVRVHTAGAEIKDGSGKRLNSDVLMPGETVRVFFNGIKTDSSPVILSGAATIEVI